MPSGLVVETDWGTSALADTTNAALDTASDAMDGTVKDAILETYSSLMDAADP